MERVIKGYDGYTITQQGNVVSNKQTKPRFLKPQRATQSKKGYYQVRLFNEDYPKGRLQYVHRLVWKTFRGEIPEGYEIDHIDAEPSNNRIENLQLLTRRENNYKYSVKRWSRDIRSWRDDMIKDYELLGTYQKVADKYEICFNTAYRVITNTTHKVQNGKYIMVRYDESINDKWCKDV